MEDQGDSVATSLSWQTHLSRTSVGSLSCAAFSDQQSRLVNGLEDVIRAVRSLNLPRFRYEDLIRQGPLGEGETYRVERCVSRDSTAVAVKHLKANMNKAEQASFRQRLRSVVVELQIMRHPPLRAHPNLPSVFGYGWNTRGSMILPFIVVEYASFGTLREYIKGRGLLPEGRLRDIAILLGDVVSGLSALHSCGIVHGDVKLDNVLVVPSWDNPAKALAKVTDFGHAIVLNDGAGKEGTRHLRYAGTTIYNAPEVQNQDTYPISRSDLLKCDIWAFGLLAWEACTGGQEFLSYIRENECPEAPTEGQEWISHGNLLELARKSLPGLRKKLGLPMFIWATLSKTLHEDPSRRASSASELPVLTKWNVGGPGGVAADLALHLETPLPTYEMFRLDNGREISWQHQQQILQGLEHTQGGMLAKDHSAFSWQLALCHYSGFGTAQRTTKAHHFARLAQADSHPLATAFADLFGQIPQLNGTYSMCVAALLRATNISDAFPPLVKACFEGDVSAVLSLLGKGASPNASTIDGCGLYHWLFMLGKGEFISRVVDALQSQSCRLLLDEGFTSLRDPHAQWPLQLFGSPLAIAISANSALGVRALLDLGADPLALVYRNSSLLDTDPKAQWTPFHVAVKYHCSDILEILLDHIATDERKSQLVGLFPLACALSFSTGLERLAMHSHHAQERLDDTVAFIQRWQDLDAILPSGMTPLMQAIDFQDHDVVSALLRTDPSLAMTPMRSPSDDTVFNLPIHFAVQIAARRDAPETLKIPMLINDYTRDLDQSVAPQRDHLGKTPLHLAVTGESDRTSRWIIEQRPGLLQVEDARGRTPLHYCTSAANCRLLLDNGANVDHADKDGITILHLACYLGNFDVTQAILKSNPRLDLSNNRFGCPLHCAVINGSLEVVVLLLEAGAPVEATDRLGNTAVHVAARLDRHAILRLLLTRQAITGAKNIFGHDAMRIALRAGRFGSSGVLRILQGEQHNQHMQAILASEPRKDAEMSVTIYDPKELGRNAHPTADFEWEQEALLPVTLGRDDPERVDEDSSSISTRDVPTQVSFDDRQGKMEQLHRLVCNLQAGIRTGNFYDVTWKIGPTHMVSLFFDEAIWQAPMADRFYETMMQTARTMALQINGDLDFVATWVSEIVDVARPKGAFPGRSKQDLEAIISGELSIVRNTAGAPSIDTLSEDSAALRNGVHVTKEYLRWLGVEKAAAHVSVIEGREAATVKGFSYFRNGNQAFSNPFPDPAEVSQEQARRKFLPGIPGLPLGPINVWDPGEGSSDDLSLDEFLRAQYDLDDTRHTTRKASKVSKFPEPIQGVFRTKKKSEGKKGPAI